MCKKFSGAFFLAVFTCLAGAFLLIPSFSMTAAEGPRVPDAEPLHYAQVYYFSPLTGEKPRVDHARVVVDRAPCLACHDDPGLGYDYVSKDRFMETRHYKEMIKRGIKGPEEACLICHVSKPGRFVANPSENWFDGGGDIEKVSNDMAGTCGKCHEEITKHFAQSLHATKKAVFYSLKDLPPPGMEKAFGTSAFNLYSKSCATCHASCSSCHLIGKDKQVIDWKYVFSNAQEKIGTMSVPIAKGITSEAKILSLGPNRNPKSGGPLYRNMAKGGIFPIETVKFDIESHDFIIPNQLDPSRANDICYRCHENPGKEFYGLGLDNSYGYSVHALAGVKCVDCHGKEEVHGSGNPELYISKALRVRCETCHEKGKEAPAHLNQTFFLKAKKVSLSGAHQNLNCSTCHAVFYGSCIGCHKDRKARYIETDINTGKPLIYFGRNLEGRVQIVTTTPRRVIPLDSKEDGGIWMMQSRHSIQKNVYQVCEECHLDPVKMGVNPLDRPILNKWEMASIGAPKAFIKKDEHLTRVKAAPQQTCISCHAKKAKNRYEQFHFAEKIP
jgi:hypothetical protein